MLGCGGRKQLKWLFCPLGSSVAIFRSDSRFCSVLFRGGKIEIGGTRADPVVESEGLMPSSSLVSILINNYNYGHFLKDAIDSALCQTYANIEVIVVDDGSTDNSREVIDGYGSQVVPVLKENGGQASAFNAGFAASKGQWIFLLDSDDLFLPQKIQRVLQLADQNPGVGMIVHNLEYCGVDGKPIVFDAPVIAQQKLVDGRKSVRQGKVGMFFPATSALCFQREVLHQMLPMPEEIRITADNYLKIAALLYSPVLATPENLARQRIHGANAYTCTPLEAAGEARELRRAVVNAQVGFHLIKRHPLLRKLICKQYGHILYRLLSAKSEKAGELRSHVKSHYSVVNSSPLCLIYVAGAFTKAFVKGFMGTKVHA